MRPLTNTERDRLERTAYRALDAVDSLVGHGLGGNDTERALESIRSIINKIQNAPEKQRRRATVHQ